LNSTFPQECSQKFKVSDEIEFVSKDKINTHIKSFGLIFTNDILYNIVLYFNQQVLNVFIKKSEYHNSAYNLINKEGLKRSDIFLGSIIYITKKKLKVPIAYFNAFFILRSHKDIL